MWTVGHSNKPLEEFLGLVSTHKIQSIVDVRRFPVSRRYPHFSQQNLEQSLSNHGVSYLHFPELGGRRSPRVDSHNTAWKNEGFRGYADYMETEPYQRALEQLVQLASSQRIALLCAEALWWQCHRSLIADSLKASGIRVLHILSPTKIEEHPYTGVARVVDGKLSYVTPPADKLQMVFPAVGE